MTIEVNQEAYLGDGVYVSFDCYSLRLRAPRGVGDHIVYLEPPVYQMLLEWLAADPQVSAHMSGEAPKGDGHVAP